MAFSERRCVRGLFGSDVDRSGTTTRVCHKASGWLDHARRAYSHEDRAFVHSAEDAIQLERYFAEPTDVRTNSSAALTPGYLGWRIVGVRVAEGCAAARVAATLKEFPVHVDDALRSSLLVKVIHILGAKEEAFTQLMFELAQREVRRVGLCCRRDSTPHGIELPDQPGITTPRMG
jgi:hypothetical protein